MPIDKAIRKADLETARDYVGDDRFVPMNFEDVGLRDFLRQYLWVIFVSGFRNAVVEKHFDGLKVAFHDLDLERIVAMDGIDARSLSATSRRQTHSSRDVG